MREAKEKKDLHEQVMAMFERRKEVESKIYIEGNHLVINVSYEYDIYLSDCDTHEKILRWCLHLKDKNWVDWDVLNVFIARACEHNGLKVPDTL